MEGGRQDLEQAIWVVRVDPVPRVGQQVHPVPQLGDALLVNPAPPARERKVRTGAVSGLSSSSAEVATRLYHAGMV